MENIKFSVFDIFAYLLPGSIVVTALVIFATPNIADISQYIELMKDISLGLGIIAIIVSYIVGNVTDNLGSWLYYKVGCKIWGDPYPKNRHPTLSHAQQRALIREYSPENFSALQTWKVLKTMSHNLSFAVSLIAIISVARFIQFQVAQWLFIAVVSIISAVILLNRANIYDRWHYQQMLETVQVLELEKRAKSDRSRRSKVVPKTKTA
jgi:hypothetical protein